MATTYRIFNTIHSATWFDGEGSFQYGGRWNSSSVRVLYTADHLSLAALEMLVYLKNAVAVGDYSWASVEFADDLILPVERFERLPLNWKSYSMRETISAIGDRWATSDVSAVLRVPTALIPGEHSYVVNLLHPDAAKIQYGVVNAFLFDRRLFANERGTNGR